MENNILVQGQNNAKFKWAQANTMETKNNHFQKQKGFSNFLKTTKQFAYMVKMLRHTGSSTRAVLKFNNWPKALAHTTHQFT